MQEETWRTFKQQILLALQKETFFRKKRFSFSAIRIFAKSAAASTLLRCVPFNAGQKSAKH